MITRIFILILSFVFSLHAQVDSALSYYPLKTGNTWQYWYHYKGSSMSESTYVSVNILGDTLMPNGKLYKIIDGPILNSVQTKYQRIDTLTASVYCYSDIPTPTERLSDSLSAQVQDVFGGGSRCTAIDTSLFLGTRTATKTFVSIGLFSPTIIFAQGLRIVKAFHYFEDPILPVEVIYTYDLVYAKIDKKEYSTLTSVASHSQNLPTHFTLEQNYPNPFNPSTVIKFSIPTNGHVSLKIFDVLGQEVATLIEGKFSKGEYTVPWNGYNVSSGVYFYRLQSNNYSETKKLLLLK
jgi:Secretion system C-terminal sorting domain